MTMAQTPRWKIEGKVFEHHGADVRFDMLFSWKEAIFRKKLRGKPSAEEHVLHRAFLVEIKPTVADEYPAVIRQMNRHGSTCLFVGAYEGEGATEPQFVAMLAASRIKVIFKRDVDAEYARLKGA